MACGARARPRSARPAAAPWPPRARRGHRRTSASPSPRTGAATHRCARGDSGPTATRRSPGRPRPARSERRGPRPAPACRSRRAATRAPPGGAGCRAAPGRGGRCGARIRTQLGAAWNSLPHVGDAGGVRREPVVVAERIAEEVCAVDTALDRLGLVLRQHHRQHDRDVRVHGEARGHAFGASRSACSTRRPTWPHPRARRMRTTARRSRCGPRGGSSRAGCRRPTPADGASARGFGITLRGGICTNSPSMPVNGSSTSIRVIASSSSCHISRLRSRSTRKPPSSAPELDSPVPKSTRPWEIRSSVAIRSATRAGWLTAGITLTIPWPSRMRSRPLGGGGEEHLGGRGVRVLLEEVVLDLPHVVEPEPVGELDLLERVEQELRLAAVGPRPGELVLVEDPEPHAGRISWGAGHRMVVSARNFAALGCTS